MSRVRSPLLIILLGVQLSCIASNSSGDPDSPDLEAVSADEIMDTESSIDDVELDVGIVARGDLRTLYSYNDVENRAGDCWASSRHL